MKRPRRVSNPEFFILRIRGDPFYNHLLAWVEEHFPALRPLFRVHELPGLRPSFANAVLHLPWLQDPVQANSWKVYALANGLATLCDLKGIPIVNRVSRLTNAGKSAGAQIVGGTGLRTPRSVRIRDAAVFRETLCGVPLPLFVREDWGHQGPMLRADTHDEAAAIPLGIFRRPVAIELIDVPDRQDGLYRKYRYIAAGEDGVTHHLQVTTDWITRGKKRVATDVTRQQELDYVNAQDPNHEAFQRARRALGLEFLAFDYGYDYEGRPVVWEVNPYPHFEFSRPGGGLFYRQHALHRTVAAMVKMYLEAAGLDVPPDLARRVAY
jgi:hypothetical protein